MSLSQVIFNITQNYLKLGGKIGNSESKFIQDSENISKKMLSRARERSWRLN